MTQKILYFGDIKSGRITYRDLELKSMPLNYIPLKLNPHTQKVRFSRCFKTQVILQIKVYMYIFIRGIIKHTKAHYYYKNI